VRCCVLLKQVKIPVKKELALGKAGYNKQVCLATFLSMFRVQRGLAVVRQWWQRWWLVNHDENPIWFSSWSWLTFVNNAERWAFSIDNIDKKPLLNLVPLENSSIRLGLERILRLVEITWPWWESTKLGKQKQAQPEWIILLTWEAQTDLPNAP
jgi:hypothetical protein